MSHLNSGLLSTYNSLTDKHLAGYFSNTRIRRHLQRAGLITRSGRIVPDKEYRHKLIQRAHQRHVRECLAQAIFHKVLEMERLHQIEIKRKLEEFAKRERVHKIKVERSKRYEEGTVHILSPHPPVAARGIRKQHSGPEGEHSESSESPSSSRPNTAPGKMQRPVRLKPIHSNSTTASVRRSSPYRLLESSHENHLPFNCTMEKEPWRHLTAVEASNGISPYCLPVINNFVTPVPPAKKRKERGLKGPASSTVRGRRLRPTTASSGADDSPLLRSSVHQSRVCVHMVYFGKTVRLSSDLTDVRDDVKVFQQHCGGENLCVYKGKLHEGESFQFISRRHRGFPFSLTFFLNGLQVERLSSCCEFKHRKGSRLGGKHGHFGFTSVEGASPCYKCIIAMGLDKKPTPPPKTIKEDTRREESVKSLKDEGETETERTGKDAASCLESETSEPQNMETPVKEETAPDEEKGRDDYDEDFEADDGGPAEEAKEEKSPSPLSDTDRQVKEKDASETEQDDRDDMRSHSGSSSSGSDHEDSDAETTRDFSEDKKAEQQKEDSQEENITEPEERDEPNPEDDDATETESSAAKDSQMDSAGDSTEIEISDTSVPSGSETRQSDDKDAEKTVEEGKEEEEQERAKSVQEKLAEAILKESQCSSEPELSDTSTEEEEEESTHKGPQPDNEDVAPDKLVTLAEQQEPIAEEAECEEGDTGEVVVAQKQEDSPETEEQSGDDEQQPQEKRDITENESVEETTEEKDKSEETGEALHPSKEENVTQDDKTTESEETPAEITDAEAAEKDEEKEEKTAEETDVQHDETGQGAKSIEEDESSVSEPDKKTDETAAPDNAEAEAVTARETIEIKAESSKEQEALSYEEAPVSDAEKGEQADSEDRAAGSETEVSAENSSSSPSGSGETTVEKIGDTSEENAIEESRVDDIKEEQILEDDSHKEQCELGEEGIGASEETDEKEDKEKTEEGEKEEEEKQTPVTSGSVEEDENTEKRDDDEKVKNDEKGDEESKADEGTEKQENAAESADNATETKEEEEEAVKILSEEDKIADDEKVEESEKTERDGDGECVENKLEESEVTEDDKNEGEYETKPAVQENDDEAEKSENQNENKAEKSEDKESKNDEEDDKENHINEKPVEGEEISETTEEVEKSADIGANEAADGTKSADETPEAQSDEQDAGKASKNSEKGEINGENGEIATEAESNNHEDEGESQLKDKSDLKTKEKDDEGSKTDGPADDEIADIKEATAESEEGANKHEADEVDQAPGADEVQRDAKEATPSNSQPEAAGTEMKEEHKLGDRKDSEEAEQDQNGNKSDCDDENKEPDLIKKERSTEPDMDEVALVSSGNQEQSPVAVDLDVMASKLDEKSKDTKSDICPQMDENAVGGDLSAPDGENGVDAEDVSKASEEGASVLLKPHTQNNEANHTEESVATGKESPEALAKEDSTDLVSNWVNKHQSSKFFETFVEPLEDMREEISDAPVSTSNKEETKSTELPRSESPLKMARVSQDEVKAYRDEEDELQVEKAEVKDLILKPETEQSEEEESVALQEMRSEEHKESMGSLQECNGQKSAEKGINEENTFSKTEEESTSGSRHSATGKPASVSKSQTDEKTTDNDFNVKEPQPEEGHQSTSPLGTDNVNETWGKADEQSREVTETTDLTTSKSDDGSAEESRNEEMEGKASDGSVGRDRKDLQLIEDIKHTLSKDRLSAFSVDDTLFAHSSYPLLTAASAESGH